MSKYRAQPVTLDGIRFASKAEAKRYGELKLMQKAGKISGLELQPEFPICVNGVKVCTYRADFAYIDHTGDFDERVTEDVKGVATPVYRLKRKLMKAVHGIEITEVAA